MEEFTKPQIGWVTAKDCAAGAGISVRSLHRWDIKPVGKIGGSNYYLISDMVAVREAEAFERGKKEGIVDALESPDSGTEKSDRHRLVAAQADAQEMKNEIARHDLAPFTFMTFVMARSANVIAGVIDSLPLECMRQLNLAIPEVEKVKAIVSVAADEIANLGNDEWMEIALDDFIEETT